MRAFLFTAAATLTFMATAAHAQNFDQGDRQEVVLGQPVQLSLSGLSPGGVVEITAERTLDYPRDGRQRSFATFTADKSGKVDISRSRPISGTYDKADPSGLFWSMTPNYLFRSAQNPTRLN